MDNLNLLKLTIGGIAISLHEIDKLYADKNLSMDDLYALHDFNAASFGEDTCYDYVSELIDGNHERRIVVFVEPCGDIEKSGKSFAEVITWWRRCFETQPVGWHYCKAGWHLYDMNYLPDDSATVWDVAQDTAREER